MRIEEEIGIIKDQVMYNIHYAPEYPGEDRTNLEREEKQVLIRLHSVLEKVSEDTKKWIGLASEEIKDGFQKYRGGQNESGRKCFEAALQFLIDSTTGKKVKAHFVAGSDGTITHQ
jgi:hypothetical protein